MCRMRRPKLLCRPESFSLTTASRSIVEHAAQYDHPFSMTIFRSLAEVPADFGPSVVTIGNFDPGVHVGHRRIMRRVVEIARERGFEGPRRPF